MATKISDDMIVPRVGRSSTYPWGEWTDGSSWEAEQGKDFTCKVASFTVILHKQAKTLGKKVVLSTTDDIVRFRFEDRPAGYVAPVRAPKLVPAPVVEETAVVGNEAALPEAPPAADAGEW